MAKFFHKNKGGVTIGDQDSTPIKAINYQTGSFDCGSIAATTKVSTSITVTGVAVGDLVIVNWSAAFEDDIVLSEIVITANTVAVNLYNPTGGAIDPAAVTYYLIWIDRT